MLQNCIPFVRGPPKKAQIEQLKALVCELQALPGLPELSSGTITVIQSKNSYRRAP